MKPEPRHDLDRYRMAHPTLGASPMGTAYGYFRIGRLNVIVAPAPESPSDAWWPWEHVSVSRSDSKELTPTWEEMDRIKHLWFEDHETVIQFHPAETDKVNLHLGCLHLWRRVDIPIELPKKELV